MSCVENVQLPMLHQPSQFSVNQVQSSIPGFTLAVPSLWTPGQTHCCLHLSPELPALTPESPEIARSGGVLRPTEQFSHHHRKPERTLTSLGLWRQTRALGKAVETVISPAVQPEPPVRKSGQTEGFVTLSFRLAMTGSKMGILTGELSLWSLEAEDSVSPSLLLSCSRVHVTMRGIVLLKGWQEVLGPKGPSPLPSLL